jgi:hypothetical protein
VTAVWVLTALFVWFSPATAWQADIRLGYFATEAECEAVGAQLDSRQQYRWEGMEAGPAWLRGWRCEREGTGTGDPQESSTPLPD